MAVRDAEPDDLGTIADLAGVSEAAAMRLMHERSIRVLEEDEGAVAFVSYDICTDSVQISRLAGTHERFHRLIEEVIHLAEDSNKSIEMVVPETDGVVSTALEGAGFTPCGNGPRFAGVSTTAYRRPNEG